MFDFNKRVLVVDDMLTMRKLVSKHCTKIGFTDIIDAEDGNKAWEAINSATPPVTLVLSDWNMPECSGLDLLKKIRGDEKLKWLPFIMITAESEKNQIVEAIKAGVSNYIVKPFSADQLKSKLEETHAKLGPPPLI